MSPGGAPVDEAGDSHEHDRSGDHWGPQAAQHVDVDDPDHDE
jgi:hypothetical protein